MKAETYLTPVLYLPVAERTVDTQFQDMLRDVRDNGYWDQSAQDDPARMKLGYQLHYNLRNGFPLMTERDMTAPILRDGKEPWPSMAEQSIGEIAAFLNGARTHKEYQSYGCYWWGRWLTAEKCEKRGLLKGDNGPGSYGAAWTHFPTHLDDDLFGGEPFDQIDGVFQQMRERPELRTHRITNWLTPYLLRQHQKVVVTPCHGDLHFRIHVAEGSLSLFHTQHKMDMLVGGINNICQYAALLMAAAQVLDLRADKLIFSISDAHYYKMQKEMLQEVLSREPRHFPTVYLTEKLTSVKDLRPHHFQIEDYHPHGDFRIPTPV